MPYYFFGKKITSGVRVIGLRITTELPFAHHSLPATANMHVIG